jgi:long-subunit acyl-CoA synthetase (AMP-forming)
VNLFNKTFYDILITTPSTKVKEYLDRHPMRLLYVPELEKLLAPGDMYRYKFNKTFEEAKDDPFLVLHTSGSSGLPKPVFLPHSWVCGPDAMQALESHEGCDPVFQNFAGQKLFCCLPPFHVSSLGNFTRPQLIV